MVLTTQRGALALVAVAALVAGVLLFSISSLASPEAGGGLQAFVDVNIADGDDPDGHAGPIGMPNQLVLDLTFTVEGPLIFITISGEPPWVEVTGAIGEGQIFEGQIFASGSGKVADIQGIAVIFEGKLDMGGQLSGEYRMGTALGLPPNIIGVAHPITYTLKPACPPGGGGGPGCPSATDTPLPTVPASETPTATPTEGAPATNTPTPTATSTSGPCTDPNPGGGELLFSGIGTPNHTADEQGGLCPGESDVWTFSTLGLGIEEFIGIRVTEKTGSVSVSILLPDGSDVALQPGEEFRESQPGSPAAYEVTVTGTAEGLASYRLEVCRAISDPCVFSEDITPTPTLRNGDVNMDGVTNSIDVLLVLQLIAGLISPTPNFDRADVNMDGEVNAVDTALMLQFDAGLLDSLPVGGS